MSADQQEMQKKLRNLKKKLKQIDDLKAKIDSGQIEKPEKEQLQKVAKRDSVLQEIEDLELDMMDI